jgi:hypothetical protein
MKLRCPELFRVPRPSEKQHILEMQAQNMLDERDSSGRRIYIFRVGQYSYLSLLAKSSGHRHARRYENHGNPIHHHDSMPNIPEDLSLLTLVWKIRFYTTEHRWRRKETLPEHSNTCLSNKMQRYTAYFIWKLLYMFRVVPPLIIRSANNCIYSIWYLSHRYCYLPLWKNNKFEKEKQQIAVTVWQIPDAVNTVVCAPDDG